MKYLHYLLFMLVLSFLTSCNQNVEIKVTGKPEMHFETLEHSFDTINFKDNAKFSFKFSNIGDQPLIINEVIPSCGCTATEFSKAPIKAGETGVIKVKYDTKRIGMFYKTIKVYTNSQDEAIVLKIKGFVKNNE